MPRCSSVFNWMDDCITYPIVILPLGPPHLIADSTTTETLLIPFPCYVHKNVHHSFGIKFNIKVPNSPSNLSALISPITQIPWTSYESFPLIPFPNDLTQLVINVTSSVGPSLTTHTKVVPWSLSIMSSCCNLRHNTHKFSFVCLFSICPLLGWKV